MAPQALRTRKSLLLSSYIATASISTLYFILGSTLYLQSVPENRFYFYPREIQQALTWLDENAPPNELVLSSMRTGELIAQYTDLRVYLGHEIETLHVQRKTGEVARFFDNGMDARWLAETSARWVFYGPYEKSLTTGGDFAFPQGVEVYRSEDIVIYKVK